MAVFFVFLFILSCCCFLPCSLDRLWDVSDASLNTFILHLQQNPPQTPDDIVNAAHSCGVGDLFPAWTADDLATIESDGKIPKHEVCNCFLLFIHSFFFNFLFSFRFIFDCFED